MVQKCYVARFSFVLYIIGEQTFKIKNKHQIIITMHKFTKLILDEYNRQGIKITDQNESVAYVAPLVELSDAQKDILSKGDGQKPNQYKQINSSTGLAVNYYKLLEELGEICELVFEYKPAIPLKGSSKNANLDVFYKRNGTLYFVESKFLEPYYSANKDINDAYLDKDRYPIEVEAFSDDWHQLFEQSKEFKYLDVTQLCRHLLALYRYTHGYKNSTYQGEPVVFQSVMWKMTERFMNLLSSSERDEMNERVNTLKEETNRCHEMFNTLINKVGWSNMQFETLHYNDILGEIKPSKYYNEFCKRYFFE